MHGILSSQSSLTNQAQCDLAQPICGKCVKSRKNCQFPNQLNAQSSNSLSISYFQNIPAISPLLSGTTSPESPNIAPGKSPLSEVEIVAWDDLELLHHFSTVTYATMGSRYDLRQMWQIQIPKMAQKHKFLMHGLFSVAALHFVCSHPENQSLYVDRAIRHHNIAIREYSFELQRITRENCTSLFACATLIVIFAFNLATLRPQEELMGPIEEISGIFMLLRGVPLVLGELWDWVRESEIAPLFKGRDLDDTISIPDDFSKAIALLEDQNRLTSKRDIDRITYTRAIQGLRECFRLISSKDRTNGMVFRWPITVSQEYIALLGSRQQMALVILAHYAVTLYELRDTWWVMGWGSKLIREVHQVINDEWKPLLAWPMDKIATKR